MKSEMYFFYQKKKEKKKRKKERRRRTKKSPVNTKGPNCETVSEKQHEGCSLKIIKNKTMETIIRNERHH